MVINFLIFFKNSFVFFCLILSQLIYFLFHKLNFPREKESNKIFSIFKNKRVLIIGAGESISKLNQKIIDGYDHVIAINHSIDITSKFNIKNLHLYSCDTNGIIENLRKRNFSNIHSIFFPFQTTMPLKIIKTTLKPNVDLIRPTIRWRWKNYKNTKLKYPSLDVIYVKDFQTWLNSTTTSLRPSTIYSSFYSLALLLIKNKIKCMGIVGIDFSYKYSNLLGSTEVGEPDGKHFQNNINSGLWKNFRDNVLKKHVLFEQI